VLGRKSLSTSRGQRWEWLHSLWILWTFTLGFFSWVAFSYVAFGAKRARRLVWGGVYLAPFVAFLSTDPVSQAGQIAIGFMVTAGMVSVVHAFAIREDYLVRLERRLDEAPAVAARTFRRDQAEHEGQTAPTPPAETDARRVPQDSSHSSTPGAAAPSEAAETTPEGQAENFTEAPTEPPRSPAPPFEAPDEPPEDPAEAPARPAQGAVPESAPEVADRPASEARETTPAREPAAGGAGNGERSGAPPMLARVADTYPLPIAYSWSLLQGLWDPRDRYREQLRHAENMLAFLGSVSLAILDDEDYGRAQLDLKVPWQGGISFGAWKLIIQRCAKVFRSYRDNPLAPEIWGLNIGAESKGFGADVAALIRARNDFHHGRGPVMEEDVADASDEAGERLRRCMEALSFFTEYPIRLVQDFDVDRRSDDFLLKCLRLEGDGPGFLQEKVSFHKPLPRGELTLDLGGGNWAQLYPFVVASNCHHCRYRETYFIDRWNDRKGTVVLKSFERGHTEEKEEIAGALSDLAERQQPEA
jgi:hypothetical protein